MIRDNSNLDYYNVLKKEKKIFEKQIGLMSDPQAIENFLTPDEVQELISIEASKPQSYREERPTKDETVVTFNNWESAECNILASKLESRLGPFEVWGGNYFDTAIPYFPHIDTGVGLNIVNYKNIIIPLQMAPDNKETFLVLFKQRYFGDNTGFYASGESYPESYTKNGELYDYSHVFGLEPSHEIDQEIFKNHLSHLNPLNLRGLSIDCILPWKIGSCLIFDSTQIHCSSDFRNQGIKRKMGYSLFTKK